MVAVSCDKVAVKFICEICDYNTVRKSSYDKHLASVKHAHRTISNTIEQKMRENNDRLTCKVCSKVYKVRNSLWYHSKKCKPIEENMIITLADAPPETTDLKSMVIELMKSNQDLQNKMFEMCKNSSTTINNNQATNNSHNKTFNLQFFLNEQCKDAMNISDFAKSFDIQLADLESVGELGYVEGISRLIVKQLNGLDLYKRPMHCSDAKRETLYVKDQDKWEKETDDNPKIRKTIKNVSSQNFGLITKWRDAYPECRSSLSEYNQQFINIVKQANGGAIEIEDNENKIIRRLTKEVVIKKNE